MKHTDKVMKRRSVRDDGGGRAIIKSSLFGFLMSVVIMLALWFVAGMAAYSNDDPDSIVGALGFAVSYLCSFAAGLVAVRKNGRDAVACGALSGVFLMIFAIILSLLFPESYSSGHPMLITLGMRSIMVFMSVLGGVAGLQRRPKHKRRI